MVHYVTDVLISLDSCHSSSAGRREVATQEEEKITQNQFIDYLTIFFKKGTQRLKKIFGQNIIKSNKHDFCKIH